MPPEKYGLRQACMGTVYQDPEEGTYVHRDRENLQNGWECGDSALKIREMMREEGREVEVCQGISSDELMHVHLFARDAQGIIYDGTPLYKPIGEPHRVERVLSEDDIENRVKGTEVFLDKNMIPIQWSQKGETHYLVACSAGLTHFDISDNPEYKQTILFVAKRKGREIACAEMIAVCDNEAYRKNGFSPMQEYTLEKSQERLRELRQQEIICMYAQGIFPRLQLEIPNDMTEMFRENLDVMCALIDHQEAARNVVQ